MPSAGGCASLEELCDGSIIASVLAELAPDHFTPSTSSAGGNWAVGVSNLKAIVAALEVYYRDVLGKRVADLDTLDCKAIARNNDTEELLNLMEVVIGVAILCDDKAVHIQEIFSLSQETQKELQVLIECVMGRVSDVGATDATADVEGAADDADGSSAVTSLKLERGRLLESLQTLENTNSSLEEQVEALTLQLQQAQTAVGSHGQHGQQSSTGGADAGRGADSGGDAGNDSSSSSVAVAAAAELQQQLFDARRDLDDRTLELETAAGEIQSLHALLSTARQMQSKSELEVQMMVDKLELATETQVRLTQAEALLEKYKSRLEELPTLRAENKENCAKLDEFVEKCHRLESGSVKLTQLLEASNHKNSELEKRLVKAEVEAQTAVAETAGLREELDVVTAQRRAGEEQCRSLRSEMVELKAAAEVAIAAAQDNAEVTVERELNKAHDQQIKQLAAESNNADQQSEALRLLEAELAAVTARKDERDQQWLEAKKQLVVSQQELTAARKAHAVLQDEYDRCRLEHAATVATSNSNSNSSNSNASEEQELALQKALAQLKEAEQQLALQSRTSKMYEERFRDKDARINALEQDKDRLETFTRRTLTAFKGKFLQSLEAVREEKRALESQLEEVIQKYQANKATAGREERLVMSAMYEIGLRTIDQNISAQLGKQQQQQLQKA